MDRIKEIIQTVLTEKKKKRDRCLRIADRKFDKPSAYKSGAVVRCRKGNIWKGLKEDQLRESIKESLRDWFKKEKWKRIDTQGNIAGDCGTMPKGKKTQRCLPQAKAQSLSKKQRAATSRKKTKSNKQFVSNTKAAK